MRVRPFQTGDLTAAARLAGDLRAADAAVESFGEALPRLWDSERARRPLWRLAETDEGVAIGLAFALERQPGELDLYGAVTPSRRRAGVGSKLLQPALEAAARDSLALHAQVREPGAGRPFLERQGFAVAGRTLLLERHRRAPAVSPASKTAVIRAADLRRPGDRALVLSLSSAAYLGVEEVFPLTEGDLGRFAAPEGLVLIGELDEEPAAYLTARALGPSLAIEEIGVLPAARRRGLGSALLGQALRLSEARTAVLAVDEQNASARGFYQRLGFVQSSARTRMRLAKAGEGRTL